MLQLYDARTGQTRPLTPAHRGELRISNCGPAGGWPAQLGDLRAFLLCDLIRRAAELRRRQVTVCRSIDDVRQPAAMPLATGRGDPDAEDRGLPREHEESLLADLSSLNIRPADHSPHASDSIPYVIEVIARLIESGHAYRAGDGSVRLGARTGASAGDQAGWALWTAAGPRPEPAWPSPWGAGMPGRHVGCVVMSMGCLGDRIDLHVGDPASDMAGDLAGSRADTRPGSAGQRWPGHENQNARAQADAVAGHELFGHWARSDRVIVASRDLDGGDLDRHGVAGRRFTGGGSAGHIGSGQQSGNRASQAAAAAGAEASGSEGRRGRAADGTAGAVRLTELTAGGLDPLAVRLVLLEQHYRQVADITLSSAMAAGETLHRWRAQVAAWAREPSAPVSRAAVTAVTAAFERDLDIAAALHEMRTLAQDPDVAPGAKFETFAHLDQLFGLDLAREVGRAGPTSDRS